MGDLVLRLDLERYSHARVTGAGPGRVATPTLEAGDAILIDEMTMHRTAALPKTTRARSWAIT